ncbi:MAG: FAD-dependent oxidoreductase [Pseudomonadota bacterium]
MEIIDLGVIGAGLAGLTVARGAAEAAMAVRVLDKGRGLGGRLATRRAGDGLRFDHGAQYLSSRDPGFRSFLDEAMTAGAVEAWEPEEESLVGLPGMSGLAKYVAQGLAVDTAQRAGKIRREDGIWQVWNISDELMFKAERLVLAVPSPQVSPFLEDDHPFQSALADVAFAPCWTLMAAFDAALDLPLTVRNENPDAILSWVTQDGSKPGRREQASYVAQASESWSRTYLERDADWVLETLLSALAELTGAPLPKPLYSAVHRWRYSTATRPLGRPYLHDEASALSVCGDWCLGNRAEHAWLSAQALLCEVVLPR